MLKMTLATWSEQGIKTQNRDGVVLRLYALVRYIESGSISLFWCNEFALLSKFLIAIFDVRYRAFVISEPSKGSILFLY